MKANRASSREATLKKMLSTELPEPPPLLPPVLEGGLLLFDCPPPAGRGVVVGVTVGVRLVSGVGLRVAVGEGVGDGVGDGVGVGVGVTGVGEGVGDGVGVGVQLHCTFTVFDGAAKVMFPRAGQLIVEDMVIVTETCPLAGSAPLPGFAVMAAP